MADSFCLIPSKDDPSMASLKAENATLKAELEQQQLQLAKMEKALKARQEQDQQLRDSIMIARKEVSTSLRHSLRRVLVSSQLWHQGAHLGFRSPQAHRAMMSSNVLSRPAQPPVDIASLNLNVPVPSPVPIPGAPVSPAPAGRERDPALVRRVRELEDEVRNLRAENEKQVRRRTSVQIPSCGFVGAAFRVEADVHDVVCCAMRRFYRKR